MGDEDFTAFVHARGRDLLRFAYLTAGNVDDAADLTQEALAAAYVHWRRLEQLESPEAYVRRAIVNRHISLWRRHRNRAVTVADVTESAAGDEMAAVDNQRVTIGMLATLPRKQRAAVVMRFFADYSDAEIAATLGCTQATVRSQIARALKRLRVDLTEQKSEVMS